MAKVCILEPLKLAESAYTFIKKKNNVEYH